MAGTEPHIQAVFPQPPGEGVVTNRASSLGLSETLGSLNTESRPRADDTLHGEAAEELSEAALAVQS